MKKNRFAACVALSVLFVFIAALIGIAADQPDTILLKSELWPEPTKGVVTFNHKEHVEKFGLACTECHHKYVDGKNVWKEGDAVQKCDECHTDATIKGEKKLPKEQQKLNLKLAFHDNCRDCHRAYKKEHKGSKAPTSCSKCHPKNKK